MPIHFMRLQPAPFALIRDGRKTIELRLYDEKRRKLQIGDGILFENTEAPEMLLVRVTGLSVFASFDALYQALPLEACGYPKADIASASPADMEACYSKEEQRRYGVVGIQLAPEHFVIDQAGKQEAAAVAALAAKLWEHPAEELAAEFSALLAREDAALFLARQKDAVVGFAQCQLRRDYVEGTSSSPVGYLEGIYVDEAHRRRGLAAVLLHACEAWAKQQGCTEFASDCELENADSLRFHLSLGFREANRIICFTKEL
jgi:aminoglycoside 6'-N-acetyltransferase I